MTDLEMTRLCAEAMGYAPMPKEGPSDVILFVRIPASHIMLPEEIRRYDPIHDCAQSMDLAYWLSTNGVLSIGQRHLLFDYSDSGLGCCWVDKDETREGFRRAIVECVAKVKKARA